MLSKPRSLARVAAPVRCTDGDDASAVIGDLHLQFRGRQGMNAEQQLFGKLGFDAQILDAGCCGMAGSFGFERDKYELSQRIGELALLPAVRAASDGTCIVADGFSCRE